jgi:hypothetical protein
LRAAHALAWRDEVHEPKKRREPDPIESKLDGKLLGPTERVREIVALKGQPIDGGPTVRRIAAPPKR